MSTELGNRIAQTEALRRRTMMRDAILARAGLSECTADNEYRSMSLLAMAHEMVERAGVSTIGRTTMEIIAQAFTTSTSDFPKLLLNVATAAVLKGYDAAGETFQIWTSKGELPDFRAATRAGAGAFPDLDEVAENQEYRHAVLTDQGETVQLGTYGKLFNVSRAAILNDDLGELTRTPLKAGRAAARKVGELAYSVLTANVNMADGEPLFSGQHSNLLVGSAISTTSVGQMAAAISQQRQNGVLLGLRLRYLIVPMALENAAQLIANATWRLDMLASLDPTVPNSSYGRGLVVISDYRLDEHDPAAWYGAANQAAFDTVEMQYLGGNDKPMLEQAQKFTVDGTSFKVRIDAGAKALDYRGLVKNPGG